MFVLFAGAWPLADPVATAAPAFGLAQAFLTRKAEPPDHRQHAHRDQEQYDDLYNHV